VRADAGNSDDYLNDEELAADAAVNDTFLRSQIRKKERKTMYFPNTAHTFISVYGYKMYTIK
jgi:hypothetical protein